MSGDAPRTPGARADRAPGKARRSVHLSSPRELAYLALAAALFLFCPAREATASDGFDLLIANALVVDGTGKRAFRSDLGVRQGRVRQIGALAGQPARQTIDAEGLVVAPGFIDVHTHLEQQLSLVRRNFRADSFIRQGVTTVITGNCGRSAPDIAAFLRQLEQFRLSLNIATLVGHNTVRQRVCGARTSPPTAQQLKRMESIVAAALESGALGLSTGLCYKPGLYAQEDEVVALVRLAARRRAVYATHIRDEAGGGQEALEEAVRTARRAEATALHICHLKAAGRAAWGTGLARLEWTRRTAGPGIRVTADLYPYTASSSTLDYLVPPEAFRALSGGSQPGTAGFRRAVDLTLEKLRRDGWEDYAHVRLAQSPRHREWVGRKISEIVTGSVRDQAAWILRHQARGNIQIISEEMNENDVRALLRAPDVVFGSDSSVRYRGMGRPHPRGAGTFPRVFAEYVRNLRLLALEDAVRRATSLPAEIFAISDRGLIREGFWADLVIFDPARIQDRATAEDPWQHPEGIAYVIVNGTVVARNGKVTGALPGRTVRRTHAEVPQPAGR